MAGSSGGAIENYSEGVKWLVGLSGAAVGGALIQYQQLAAQSMPVRVLLALALACFLASIYTGVEFLVWVNTASTYKAKIDELDEKIPRTYDAAARDEMRKTRDEVKARLAAAPRKYRDWNIAYRACFAAALLFSGVGLLMATVVSPVKAAEPKAPVMAQSMPGPANTRFAVTHSASHATSHGRDAHTFLLDQETGEMWQMVCAPGGVVAFQRVIRLGTDRKPERTVTAP